MDFQVELEKLARSQGLLGLGHYLRSRGNSVFTRSALRRHLVSCRCRRLQKSHPLVCSREPDRESEAAPLCTFDGHLSAMRAHDATDNEKPEAGSARLGRKIGFENAADVLRGNSPTRIGKGYELMSLVRAGLNPQKSTTLHRLEGIANHVVDRLLDLIAIDFRSGAETRSSSISTRMSRS